MTQELSNPLNSSPTAEPMPDRLIQRHWQPQEIRPPTVDPAMPYNTGIERSAEVFRYTVLAIEYWLAPSGFLREWARLNAKVAVVLAVPLLLVGTVITYTLMQFSQWLTLLFQTMSGLVMLPLAALLLLGLILAAVSLGKIILNRNPHRRPLGYYE